MRIPILMITAASLIALGGIAKADDHLFQAVTEGGLDNGHQQATVKVTFQVGGVLSRHSQTKLECLRPIPTTPRPKTARTTCPTKQGDQNNRPTV